MLACLMFLISVAYLPGIPSAVSTPRWIAAEIGFSLLFLFTRATMTTAHKWGAACLMIMLLTSVWTVSFYDSAGSLLQWVTVALAFIVAAEEESLDGVWWAIAGGAIINAWIALMQVNGSDIGQSVPALIGSSTGLFGNKNFLANFGVLALLGAIILRNPLLIAGTSVAAFLPMSRGAIVAFGVGLLTLINVRGRIWGAMLVLAIVCISFDLWLHPQRGTERPQMWDWTITNFRFFGWGIGNYGTIFPFEHASNDPLEFIFELGIGAGIVFGLMAFILVECEGEAKAVFAAALVQSLFAFPLHQCATVIVAAVAAGHLAGRRHRLISPQSYGRVYCESRVQDTGPLGAGAIHETDLRRQAVPLRPQHPHRSGQIRKGI